jgi:hypothetical protein
MRHSAIALAAVLALGTATTAIAAPRGIGGGGGGVPHASFGGGGGGVPHASFSAPAAGANVHSNFAAVPNVGASPRNFAAAAPNHAAGGWRDHGRHFRGYGFGLGGLYAFGGSDYYGYDYYGDGCWQRRWVPTPYGMRWRLVDVCD